MTYASSPEMQDRKRRRRERLLKTAVALFGRKGYHATTVPAIVRRARSSVGSFYFYFRNKEQIFSAALEEAGEDLGVFLDGAVADGAGARARVRALSERCVLWLTSNPAEARILILESSGLSKPLDEQRGAIYRKLSERFAAALQGAGPTGKDREAAAHCFLGAAFESARRWLETPEGERDSGEETAARVGRIQQRRVG